VDTSTSFFFNFFWNFFFYARNLLRLQIPEAPRFVKACRAKEAARRMEVDAAHPSRMPLQHTPAYVSILSSWKLMRHIRAACLCSIRQQTPAY
jgi:hypothetical protein